MEVILVSHSEIVNHKNPAGDDYLRYQPKIGGKEAPALLKEWAQNVFFAAYEDLTTDPKKGTVKGVATGQRVIHTQRMAAWDAKNRFDLPPTLPLDYLEYAAAREAWYTTESPAVDPEETYRACVALADQLEQPADAPIRKFLETSKGNAGDLLRALNKLRVKAAEAGKGE